MRVQGWLQTLRGICYNGSVPRGTCTTGDLPRHAVPWYLRYHQVETLFVERGDS